MFKIVAVTFMMMSLLVSPFGQTADTSHACDMTSDTLHHVSMNMMEDDMASMDCCETECICPINACHSVNFLSTDSYAFDYQRSLGKISNFERFSPQQQAKNLFKPPIYA